MIGDVPDGIRLEVRVQPRASKTEVAGVHEGRLKIRLAALPVDGAANVACSEFLADVLGVPKTAVSLASGQKAREKSFRIKGDPVELRARLAPYLI